MSLGKRNILKNISTKTQITGAVSNNILNSFINIIKSKSKHNLLKISNFGTFYIHESPVRTGRNPKTGEEFLIPKTSKLSYKPSNKIKKILN
jgi:integration host factor subunit alpha